MDEDWTLPLDQRKRYRGPMEVKALTHRFVLEASPSGFILRRDTGETAALFPAAEEKLARYLCEVLFNNNIKAEKLKSEVRGLEPPARGGVPATCQDKED